MECHTLPVSSKVTNSSIYLGASIEEILSEHILLSLGAVTTITGKSLFSTTHIFHLPKR